VVAVLRVYTKSDNLLHFYCKILLLKQVFEEFLQRLLQKPTLRGSDLLHSFLRSPGEFVPAGPGGIAGAMPEGLGRMIRRSVPLRLRKEKGQHLDTFLNAFVASTEGSKIKPRLYLLM
jgi:sorting nexin-14